MRLPLSRPAFGTLCLAAALFAGCKENSVRIYDTSKDADLRARPESIEAHARSVVPETPRPSSGGELRWSVPQDWTQKELSQFRRGSYGFSDDNGALDISVTSFPGDTGGLLANINRWLGQVGLPPIDKARLDELTTERKLKSGLEAIVVDLASPSPEDSSTRIYAAIVSHAGQSWFFKATGPHATLESQIPNFLKLVDSISAPAPAPLPNAAATPENAAPASQAHLHFEAPPTWKPSTGSSLRIASFAIENPSGKPADFSLIAFPGDTGGTLANVNRWRRQIGLSEWNAADLAAGTETLRNAAGLQFEVFDLKSGGPKGERATNDERILAAILAQDGTTWFFKLRGDDILLGSAQDDFNAFLESVTLHTGTH